MATGTERDDERISGAVRAELARRRVNGSDLAAPLGLNRNTVYSRIRGESTWRLDELSRLVDFVGIDMATLIASADLDLREAS